MKFIIIILNIFIATCINAQNIDSRIADELLFFEHKIYTSASDSVTFNALLDKAYLYTSVGFYDYALHELERARKHSVEHISGKTLDYEKAKILFLDKKYNHVSDITIPVTDLKEIGREKEYFLMQLYSLNEQEKWSHCKRMMLELCNTSDSSITNAIKQLPENYNYKSPEKCKRQSGILPGLGQVTAGYPLKGGTSFLLHSGLTTFLVYNIATGFYITAIVSAALPLLKFYKGGKRLSAILAEEQNNRNSSLLKDKYANAIKMVLNP